MTTLDLFAVPDGPDVAPWDAPWPEGTVVSDDPSVPDRLAVDAATAALSPCGTWRYALRRRWGPGPVLVWVMLNPSRADGRVDDHTIRRCVALAKRDGYGAITVVNLYAYRTPYPEELDGADDPVGPVNDTVLRYVVGRADAVVAAWGGDPRVAARTALVVKALGGRPLWCLGVTASGSPRHPSRVRRDAAFEPYVV